VNVLSNSSTGKGIKTSVKLDVKDAEKKLKLLEKRIAKINSLTNSSSVSLNKLTSSLHKIDSSNKRVASSAKSISKGYRDANSAVSVLTKNLRTLASTYLGVMGAKAVTGASDTITSSENRLNQLNGNNPQETQQTMDKMYSSAQKARMGYSDMVQNVSKSMTLAGDAFQGNIDNAIRFQEIMAEAYTLGGASAAEQHSSMYQMIQGLGSGILQGDELRSVREGAPIAYREIEKFAQGVYKTEESLKDMASQGMITSELVVAAMMQAGEGIDIAFAETEMTFAQAFTNMRNVALKSFEPVLQKLNDFLNSTPGQAIVQVIGTALYVIAQSLLIVFGWVEKIYNFVKDNWETITDIIMSIGSVIAIALLPALIEAGKQMVIWVAKSVIGLLQTIYLMGLYLSEWLAVHWMLLAVTIILGAVVVAIIWVADSFVDACGIIVGSAYMVGAAIENIMIWIGNVALGLWESLKAICTNIGIAFENAWNTAKSAFWGFVADCLEGIKSLEPAINAIAEAFGAKGFTLSGLISDVSEKAKAPQQKSYVSVADAWNKGYNTLDYKNTADAYDKGYEVGTKFGNWVTDKVTGVKDWFSEKFNMDGLDEIIDPLGSNGGLGGSYDPTKALNDIGKGVGDTADSTGKIADSMELTKEDLEYLRRVADMEWKKEFTTANITVDMSNYNTISGDGDLDGIVTRLADKLYEELDMVANGVYA
jgi:tape measure domain-containing protein